MSTLTTTTTFKSYHQVKTYLSRMAADIGFAEKRISDIPVFAADGKAQLDALAPAYGTFIAELRAELDALVLAGTDTDKIALYTLAVREADNFVARFQEDATYVDQLVLDINTLFATSPI